ncbi:MAG: MmgE/PrpD family protein [Acetobacteraceae bacterium]
MTTDPARALAAHVCRTAFDALPPATVEATKRDIGDTLGCLLGGSSEPGIAELLRLATRWGGTPECDALLLGAKLPAPQAAALNASMAHALDFDDTLDHGGSIHPGASLLGATLAVAQLTGATGRQFVLAYALGLDVSCRIALAATVDRGWHRTAAIGVFGAAAAAGKLLGLDEDRMTHALGIAYSQAAGNRQCIVDGALTKRLQAGQAASSGVFAALLAQDGFTGAANIFAGKFGFYELYQPGGYDIAKLTDSLGTQFRGDEVSFKPYACGRPFHAVLDAALALRQSLAPRADQIAAADLVLDGPSYADQFESGPHKRRPGQIVEAQFALPFLVATALLRGKVGIAEVAAFTDADVLVLAARITGAPGEGKRGWGQVTVRLSDGRSQTLETTAPLGSPANPLSPAQREAKFRDCAANAVRPIAPDAIAQALAMLSRLEAESSMAGLVQLFTVR